jgi:molybdate transport system substrate-binding protein
MRTNSGVWRTLIVVLASTMLIPGVAGAAEIRVMLSGGFAVAYLELIPEFERATGHTVSTVRGGSTGTTPNSIPSRLQRGEPVDVVVMNGNALDGLVKDGKIAAGTHVDLGRTNLGLAIRAGSPKPDIGSVDAFKRAMRSAQSIAYASNGRTYLFTELFPRLGIADQVEGKSLMVEGAAEAVGTAVARGEAEIGLHIMSELLPVPGIDVVGPLPDEIERIAPLGRRAVFSAGIVVGAKEPDAGSALIKFLASPAAAPVITKSGLEPFTR